MFLEILKINLQLDAPTPWGIFFQDSASPQMEGIEELHNNMMFYLSIILFTVTWMMITIIRKFYIKSKYYKLYNYNYNKKKVFHTLESALPSSAIVSSNLDNKSVSYRDGYRSETYSITPPGNGNNIMEMLRMRAYHHFDNANNNREVIKEMSEGTTGRYGIIEKKHSNNIPANYEDHVQAPPSHPLNLKLEWEENHYTNIETEEYGDFDFRFMDMDDDLIDTIIPFMEACVDSYREVCISLRLLDELDNICSCSQLDTDFGLTSELARGLTELMINLCINGFYM